MSTVSPSLMVLKHHTWTPYSSQSLGPFQVPLRMPLTSYSSGKSDTQQCSSKSDHGPAASAPPGKCIFPGLISDLLSQILDVRGLAICVLTSLQLILTCTKICEAWIYSVLWKPGSLSRLQCACQWDLIIGLKNKNIYLFLHVECYKDM